SIALQNLARNSGYGDVTRLTWSMETELIKELLPQGIICVESALFHYGYSDFAPREWSIAVPRTAVRTVKRVQEISMKTYYIQREFLNLGKTMENF
ncbi:DUF5724 domain-containing protein, partial [Phocaeicola vulgatus]|uniref:DUF5724 domain-containing protein n=1 Tax=Phocaeicola vulgatus TaxID=821 RepID=UPI001C86C5CC